MPKSQTLDILHPKKFPPKKRTKIIRHSSSNPTFFAPCGTRQLKRHWHGHPWPQWPGKLGRYGEMLLWTKCFLVATMRNMLHAKKRIYKVIKEVCFFRLVLFWELYLFQKERRLRIQSCMTVWGLELPPATSFPTHIPPSLCTLNVESPTVKVQSPEIQEWRFIVAATAIARIWFTAIDASLLFQKILHNKQI